MPITFRVDAAGMVAVVDDDTADAADLRGSFPDAVRVDDDSGDDDSDQNESDDRVMVSLSPYPP